jgi:hypothetical protein
VRHYYRARLNTLKEELYKSICCQDITWRSCSFLNENEVAHFITFMQLSHDKTSVDDGRKSYLSVILYVHISVRSLKTESVEWVVQGKRTRYGKGTKDNFVYLFVLPMVTSLLYMYMTGLIQRANCHLALSFLLFFTHFSKCLKVGTNPSNNKELQLIIPSLDMPIIICRSSLAKKCRCPSHFSWLTCQKLMLYFSKPGHNEVSHWPKCKNRIF